MPSIQKNILLLLAMTGGLFCGVRDAHAALGENLQTANTAFWWYYGQTPNQVSELISTKDARLVSLRVESASPLLFDVALVQNTKTYEKAWWWYYGMTAQQLQDLTTANDARIVNLEPYVVDGTTLFAAIMIHNVGADYSGWWWYYGVTPSEIASLLKEHNARLVDFRQYFDGSSTVYGVVMVPNTGANQSGWWWYYGVSIAQISQLVSQNNAYVISIDPANSSGTAFNVVMNRFSPGFNWWWYVGQTEAQVNTLWQTNRARVFDVKSYVLDGERRFAVLMLGNSWTSAQAWEAECDSNVISKWHSTIPAVGLGSSSATASYDSTITGLMKKYGVPGGAVAVMDNGRLVLARGYGLSDVNSPLIAHPDSLFRIASLSKQITSAAVLKLVQEGKLSLSTKVFPLLGFTADPSGKETSALASITVQDLLDHTGGWSRETGCTGCSTEGDPMFESQTIAGAQGKAGPPSCDQIIQYMLTQPVKWNVGKVYDYSNFGYCTLGAVIEKVTGTTYPAWVTENVLADAGATGIVQGQTIWPADREVVYYDYPGASAGSDVFAPSLNAFTEPYGGFYLEAMAAHGAWVSSPVDLLRFQGAIDGRSGVSPLLTTKSISEMTQNPNVLWAEVNSSNKLVTQKVTGTWYGMGWQINSADNWWHSGSLPGTATEQVHASNGWGWAAFFNSRPSDSNGFANDLDNALWTAFNGTGSWVSANLFDQYGAYTNWMNSSSYQSFFNKEAAAGRYPSRIEGASVAGTPLYRGVFAPFHATSWESHHGLSCPAYQSYASSLERQGYQTASLQSYVANDGTRRYQATWVKW